MSAKKEEKKFGAEENSRSDWFDHKRRYAKRSENMHLTTRFNPCIIIMGICIFINGTSHIAYSMTTNSTLKIERLSSILYFPDEAKDVKTGVLVRDIKTRLKCERNRTSILYKTILDLGITNLLATVEWAGGTSSQWKSILVDDEKLFLVKWNYYKTSTVSTNSVLLSRKEHTELIEQLTTLTGYSGLEGYGWYSPDRVVLFCVLYKNGKRVNAFAVEMPDDSLTRIKEPLELSQDYYIVMEVIKKIQQGLNKK